MRVRQCAPVMNKDSTIRIKSLTPGVTAASGFVAAGVGCGVRDVGRRDLGLLFSELPCETAAVFTRNAIWGAPLAVTREAVETGGVQAVVVNSGNANAATGGGGGGGGPPPEGIPGGGAGVGTRGGGVGFA